jgi:peroxiredoxin
MISKCILFSLITTFCLNIQNIVGQKLIKDFPDFELTELQTGEVITNQSLEGKYYLFYVWSTTCGICLRELPDLKRLYEETNRENLEILALSLDMDPGRVRKHIEEHDLKWLQTMAGTEGEDIMRAHRQFEFEYLPSKILVSPNGKIIKKVLGASEGDFVSDVKRVIQG